VGKFLKVHAAETRGVAPMSRYTPWGGRASCGGRVGRRRRGVASAGRERGEEDWVWDVGFGEIGFRMQGLGRLGLGYRVWEVWV